MTNTLNKDDDLLILSDNNSIDFGESLSSNEKVEDDFAFTILEEENPVKEEISSTKSELNDLLASTSSSTKNELADLGSILGTSTEEKVEKKEEINFEDSILTFDETPTISENISKTQETSEAKNELFDLFNEVKTEEKKVEETPKIEEKISFLEETVETPVVVEEPKKEEEKNSFVDALATEVQEIKTETEVKNNSNNVFTEVKDISEILASTIGQFVKRAEIVNSEIAEKLSHIKILEAELATEKDLLSDLENEKKAIEINQTAIEKMKNDYENPAVETKTKKTSK